MNFQSAIDTSIHTAYSLSGFIAIGAVATWIYALESVEYWISFLL